MNDFLSPDEIDALFARASEGNLPMQDVRDASAPRSGKRTRWLRTVDFTRPTKFSADQERRLRRLLDVFCGTASQRVMAEHRLPIEFEVIDVQQLTWSNAFKLLPAASVHCTAETAPHEGRVLWSTELPLLVAAVEGLTGGDPTDKVKDRELTDIDLLLVRRLVKTFIETLSGIWFDQAEITLNLTDVTALGERVQVAAGSEPTIALTMEARLHNVSSTCALLIPYAAIAPAAAAFSQRDEEVVHRDTVSSAAVRDGLERVEITLRAEVADAVLTLHDLCALRPGDTIELNGSVGDEVVVYADRTPVHRARAGRHDRHRAVQILGPAVVAE